MQMQHPIAYANFIKKGPMQTHGLISSKSTRHNCGSSTLVAKHTGCICLAAIHSKSQGSYTLSFSHTLSKHLQSPEERPTCKPLEASDNPQHPHQLATQPNKHSNRTDSRTAVQAVHCPAPAPTMSPPHFTGPALTASP
jgi:hypothetical protein